MASVGRQNLQVWMFWLLIASCGGLKEDDVLKSPKKEIFTRRDYSIHAKRSPQPSIKRVVYYGHLTMGTKKLNLSAEGNPIANDAELFSGSFGDSTDYQSDSYSHVFKGPEDVAEGVFSQNRRTPAVDRLLGMKPKVECVENSMTLKLHGAAPLGVPFHIDRGNAYPLSLSEMPSVCGYTMRRSWRDLVFSTPYDGCFVAQKESIYVLPLVIYGIPVRMACPSIAPTPPSVTCHASGMTVKIESSASVKDVQVKVNRKWESLMEVSPQCGFSVVEHPDGVIISVTYLPCIEEQDGMFTFEALLQSLNLKYQKYHNFHQDQFSNLFRHLQTQFTLRNQHLLRTLPKAFPLIPLDLYSIQHNSLSILSNLNFTSLLLSLTVSLQAQSLSFQKYHSFQKDQFPRLHRHL
ncbi:hypothetical protein AALO_G00009850 [Alosa alosa]|uniref:Uncharacterized protein n=1 Tax=Alosa alosa TaxID=278164 RepID=A0AAV6HHT0_9TELE|nr:hypothetical protein AALO_G00009850 [Alosa alosa]